MVFKTIWLLTSSASELLILRPSSVLNVLDNALRQSICLVCNEFKLFSLTFEPFSVISDISNNKSETSLLDATKADLVVRILNKSRTN